MEFAALVLFGRGTFHACVSKTPATSPSISVWIIINISGLWTCWQDREGKYLYRPLPRWTLNTPLFHLHLSISQPMSSNNSALHPQRLPYLCAVFAQFIALTRRASWYPMHSGNSLCRVFEGPTSANSAPSNPALLDRTYTSTLNDVKDLLLTKSSSE